MIITIPKPCIHLIFLKTINFLLYLGSASSKVCEHDIFISPAILSVPLPFSLFRSHSFPYSSAFGPAGLIIPYSLHCSYQCPHCKFTVYIYLCLVCAMLNTSVSKR